MRAGKANLSAIAIACGFDRQVLYKNPGAVACLNRFIEIHGGGTAAREDVSVDPKPKTDRKDKRILQLEQQLATARAECVGLREKLRRLEHVENHMVGTGRRVVSLSSSLGEIGKP